MSGRVAWCHKFKILRVPVTYAFHLYLAVVSEGADQEADLGARPVSGCMERGLGH